MPTENDLRSRTVNANGATIPGSGFGTYGMSRRDMLRMIPAALHAGFRHIDTGQIYGNDWLQAEGELHGTHRGIGKGSK